jgi:fumarate reductase iron-sulfur subunit
MEQAATALSEIEIEVLRYHPELDAEPRFQTFRVAFSDDMSVLQGLQYVKDHLDGTLAFRWSCRMAVCGSCGLMVNGVPRLSCNTFLRDYHPGKLRIEPLSHFPIERDLIVDQQDFLEKLEAITPYIVPGRPGDIEDGPYAQTPAELERFKQFSGCINCLLCYAACPQYGLDPTFQGPGILALLHRYNEDSRDAGRAHRMSIVNAQDGVWGCTLVGYCSDVCPKGVDPAAAVNRNKVNSTLDYFSRFLLPRGAG